MSIVDRAARGERRRLQHMIQRSREVEEVRRATAILALMDGESVTQVAKRGAAACSTVYRWVSLYQTAGISELRGSRRGRSHWTVTNDLIEKSRCRC